MLHLTKIYSHSQDFNVLHITYQHIFSFFQKHAPFSRNENKNIFHQNQNAHLAHADLINHLHNLK